MQIETYECEELKASDATTMAVDAEAVALIEQLGLEGQQAITNKETMTREPYREMTKLELFVWSTACPEKTEVNKYRLSPIPLRILQVIAYAKSLGIYRRIEVWHPQQIKDDPLLVGMPNDAEYSSRRHLLARWGDSLAPFTEMQERAKAIFARKLEAELKTIKREADAALANIDARVQASMDAEAFNLPTFYHIAEP